MPYAGAMSHPDVAAALQVQLRRRRARLQPDPRGDRGGPRVQPRQRDRLLGRREGRAPRDREVRTATCSSRKHELALGDRWFEQRGEIIILLARLLPVVRTFIAFPAGVARMNRTKFHVYTFVGSLPWCLGAGLRGAAARPRAPRRALAAQELHAQVRRRHRGRDRHRRGVLRVVAGQDLPAVQARGGGRSDRQGLSSPGRHT